MRKIFTDFIFNSLIYRRLRLRNLRLFKGAILSDCYCATLNIYFQTPIPTQYLPQNTGLSTKYLDAIIEFCNTLVGTGQNN
ncbi:MAG TPA: hypothetical protein DDY12_01105 [Porphyromonadaceae bacterium]|nr:hypothetical protein [Porphyromonadaceae bacterium]